MFGFFFEQLRAVTLLLLLAGAGACVSSHSSHRSEKTSKTSSDWTFAKMERRIVERPIPATRLSKPGPFRYTEHLNWRIALSPRETVITDAFIPDGQSPAPLVVFVHGNHSSKEAHRNQAKHLASWGFHSLALQMTKKAEWPANGDRLARLIRILATNPSVISERLDPRRIFVAGHSFGGSAATLAAASGAPVAGLILLDPAVVGPMVENAIPKVKVPAIVLGADRSVYKSRKRGLFWQRLGAEAGELSIRGATHDDAQHPSMFSLSALGVDPWTSESQRRLFLVSITASALSLATTGSFELTWETLKPEIEKGRVVGVKRRTPSGIDDQVPGVW